MKTKIYLSLIVITGFLFLFGCSKKNPSDTAAPEPQQPAFGRQLKPAELNLPKLEYVDDIEKLGVQIAGILNKIQTIQDAEQAVKTLTPLGIQYRDLNRQFSKYYFQDRGPAFNKFKMYPKDVQQALLLYTQRQMKLEKSAVYTLYGKNLPKNLKFKVSDAAQFSGLSLLFMDKQEWQQWKKCMDAPYIPPDSNAVAEPHLPVDPNG